LESELVSDSDSLETRKGDTQNKSSESSPFLAYTKIFKESFPFYLSIGMTYDEYWNQDAELARYCREAFELQRQRKNQELWMQGLYVYHAIADTSPILHDFAKKGTKAEPYLDEPLPLTVKDIRERKERKEREKYERIMSYMKNKKDKGFQKGDSE
jgi:hypothetical protein